MRSTAEIRVLHVDDDRSFLDVSKMILSEEGNFQIDLAYSVDEALEKITCGLYDVVVSDYDMPIKNGLDFLKLLRKKCSGTPFILFTGKGREEIAVQALNLGADRYINKQGDPKTVYTELSVGIYQLYEKSRAQKMLWESEERFKKMVTNNKDLVMLTRNDGAILYVSPACKKILGYEPEELIGKNSPWIVHFEDSERIQKIFKSALTNPVSDTVEYRIMTKQGETRWLSHSFSQIIENGEIKQVVSTIKDITDAKNAEEKLRESEEKFSVAFRSDGAALTISRLVDGLFIDINDCFLKMFGYTREEVIGKTSLQIHLYANPKERQEIVNQVLNNQPVINREVKALKKDFTEIIVLFSTKIVHISSQSHLLTTFIDITNLKQTEKALFLRQKEMENFIAMAPDGVTIVNTEGKIINCNEAALTNIGYTKKEEIIGHPAIDFISENDKQKIIKILKNGFKGETVKNVRFNVKKRDGKEATMEGSAKAVLDESGKPTAFVTIIRDITNKINEEKKIANSLAQSQRRASNLRELLAVSQILLKNTDTKSLLNRILSSFKKIVPCELGLIILTKNNLAIEVALFHKNSEITTIQNDMPDLIKICQEVCIEGKGDFINDLAQSKFSTNLQKMPYAIPRNAAFVPLKNKQQVIGYIVLANRPNGFNENDILIGSLLAEFAQIALENNSAVEKITKSELQLRAITEAARDAIIMIDSEAKISFWSSAAVQMFGYTFAEICGKDFHKIFTQSSYQELNGKCFTEAVGKTLELRGRRKDGQEFPVEISLALTHIVEKSSIVCIIRDITERQIMVQKLKESEERYRFVADNAMDLISIHDLKGTFLYASPSVKSVLGFSAEDLIGKKSITELINPIEISKFNSLNIELFENGNAPPVELNFLTEKGPIWLEAKINVVQDESKEKRIIAITRDVTQSRIVREERDRALAKAQLLLEKLSVVGRFVRHDIRNKLAIITGLIYLTNKKPNIDETLKKQLDEMATIGKNINRILDFAEAYEYVGSQGLLWIQINKAINEAKDLLTDLKNLRITLIDLNYEVLADSALVTIFHNLLDNSIKYGKSLTKISINAEKQANGSLKIIYEDNGGGIDAKIKPRLFEKGAGKGTGLGLYLIRRICEIYGWTVKENGLSGKSARFEIEIPKKSNRQPRTERYLNVQIAEFIENIQTKSNKGT